MKKKVIIIGGGISGLSAGIYALKAGFDAEIYEKNPVAGGECTGWNRNGYHIDNCIHWLTGSDPKDPLWGVWKELGAVDENTEYVHEGKYYTSIFDGKEVTLWTDLEKTRQELLAIAPEDADAINLFIEHVEYAKDCVFPVEKPLDMMRTSEYIRLDKRMGNMPKVIKTFGKVNMADFGKMFTNPVLRAVMTDYLFDSYTAYSFLVSYATMASGNGKIPVGGSLAMTRRIIDRFTSLGGKLHFNTPVRRIVVEKKTAAGIELENGEIITGDEIISAVDTSILFTKLVDQKYMPKQYVKAYANPKGYPTFSGFQAAFAVDGTFSRTGTVLFDCRDLKVGEQVIRRMSVRNYAYEKSFAPEGKSVLQFNVSQGDADYLWWKSLDKESYRAKKAELVKELEERIYEQFEELRGKLTLLDCWTPLTYERYFGAFHGAYMSFITTKESKRLAFKGEVKLKHFEMAGQWIMCPGGLPIAAVSGKYAIQRILKKEGRPVEL